MSETRTVEVAKGSLLDRIYGGKKAPDKRPTWMQRAESRQLPTKIYR